MNVLSAHLGHATIVESDSALLCRTCEREQGRVTRLLLPRSVTTTAPPRWRAAEKAGADPRQNPQWLALRQRFGGKR